MIVVGRPITAVADPPAAAAAVRQELDAATERTHRSVT
jgi:orotidine-5'-phosphate decarboxylase